MDRPPYFTEVQRPPVTTWVVVVVTFGGVVVWIEWLMGGLPPGAVPPLLIGFCVALVAVATTDLRTTVTSDEVRVKLWPFGSRTVRAGEIESCEPVTYRPLRDYGGRGWRWTPWAGTAYTMHGKHGVRIKLRNGKTFLIGSQRADALAVVIRRIATQDPPSGA